MVRFLRSGNPQSFVLFTILILLCRLPLLFSEVETVFSPSIYNLNRLLQGILLWPIFNYFLSSFFILIQGFWLNSIYERNALLGKKTYLIYFFYGLFNSLHASTLSFEIFHFVAFGLIFLVQETLAIYQSPNSDKKIFNVAFLLSSFALFLPSLYWVFISLLIAIQSFRAFRTRDYFLPLIGLILPLYLIVSILYLINSNWWDFLLRIKSNIVYKTTFSLQDFWIESSGFLILSLLLIMPFRTFAIRLSVNKIRAIKSLTWMIWFLLICFVSQFIFMLDFWRALPYASISLSLILSIFVIQSRPETLIKYNVLLFVLVLFFNLFEVFYLHR